MSSHITIYENAGFKRIIEVTNEHASHIVGTLTTMEQKYPSGSSFAVTPSPGSPGYCTVYLSDTNAKRLGMGQAQWKDDVEMENMVEAVRYGDKVRIVSDNGYVHGTIIKDSDGDMLMQHGEDESSYYTNRGLKIFVDITDLQGDRFTVQESSLVTEPAIWIGGISGRGHLSMQQAKLVLSALNMWVDIV